MPNTDHIHQHTFNVPLNTFHVPLTVKAQEHEHFVETVVKSFAANIACEKGSRCDVSTLTTNAVDSDGDIIVPDGLDWNSYTASGSSVYLEHHDLPVGRALWIKRSGDSWLAKTHYTPAPSDWPSDKKWLGDAVFDKVQKGELSGKSVSLVVKKSRLPNPAELLKGAKRIIEQAIVMAYSVCKSPINPETMVLAVAKAKPEVKYVATRVVEAQLEQRLLTNLNSLDVSVLVGRVLSRLSGKVG